MSKNSQIHLCAGKCPRFDGEQCNTCLVSDDVCDFAVGDLVVVLNPRATKNIFHIEHVKDGGVEARELIASNFTPWFFFFSEVRLATLAEKAAGYRIDNPARDEVVMRADELEITPYICSICKDLTTPTQTEKSKLIPFQQVSLLEKNSRLKFNNQSLKVALAMSIVAGVAGWLL